MNTSRLLSRGPSLEWTRNSSQTQLSIPSVPGTWGYPAAGKAVFGGDPTTIRAGVVGLRLGQMRPLNGDHMRLRRAIIFAKDIERMTVFYRDALGLTPLSGKSSEWIELDAGGVALALHAIPDNIAKGIEIINPPVFRAQTPIKLVFEVSDIEIARDQLIKHGAVMLEPSPWGTCDGADPEGNVFQVVTMQRSPQ